MKRSIITKFDRASISRIDLTGRGERHAACLPFEEQQSEFMLEVLNLAAECGGATFNRALTSRMEPARATSTKYRMELTDMGHNAA